MKKYIAFLLLTFSTTLQAQDHFIGNWAADDGSLMIEIYAEDSNYYAKVKAYGNPKTDHQVVLIQMAKKSETQLYGGTYYDVASQTEYEAKLKLIDHHTMRLKILSGLFSKTIFWHRVDLNLDEKTNSIIVSQH